MPSSICLCLSFFSPFLPLYLSVVLCLDCLPLSFLLSISVCVFISLSVRVPVFFCLFVYLFYVLSLSLFPFILKATALVPQTFHGAAIMAGLLLTSSAPSCTAAGPASTISSSRTAMSPQTLSSTSSQGTTTL
jgi:hypothetical protein